jgi:positive regulator of sigma E activity
MATIIVPLIVLILGALMYALAANPKLQEMGRLLFFVGAFWLVQMFAGRQVHF